MHKTTLEQWFLLDKVIELGSFARAVQATHRSQSSVSYNLVLLQERLGVALLEAKGCKAEITLAGALLLEQVRLLLNAFHYVETQAATLKKGGACVSTWWSITYFPVRRCLPSYVNFSSCTPIPIST